MQEMTMSFAIRNGLSRRDVLKLSAAGVASVSMSGWLPVLAARAAEQGPKRKACIVLWMDGGPPQTDTFDMKPENPEGIFKSIVTSVPGIRISELLPQFAKLMDHAALVRSMSTVEGDHVLARYPMRTGYRQGQGGLSYPSLGSIVSAELGDPNFPVPNYVAVGDTSDRSHGPGFLGSRFQPLFVHDVRRGVENLKSAVDAGQLGKRLSVLDEIEQGFARDFKSSISQDHKSVYARAVKLMQSDKAAAFDLSREPLATRRTYGETKFAERCLLARRLIETGVKYVEVNLGGWDTHFENNDAVRKLCADLDPVMSALITDLKTRGLLDDTLVVWMGEFGRTPRHSFKGNGRGHHPRAWSTVLMGGGVKGGQVIGRTDKLGGTVEERPVSAADFFATICTALGIDHSKLNNTPGGRRIPLVEKEAKPIKEVLS
jgi:hypothetical protein